MSFNKFPQLAGATRHILANIVKEGAILIETNAMNNAPFDTGFLSGSAYHVTAKESDYGRNGAPLKGGYLLPEVEPPSDEFTAYAAVGANYGAYVEYGTRHMAAQPFFNPAVDAAGSEFDLLLSDFEEMLKGEVS